MWLRQPVFYSEDQKDYSTEKVGVRKMEGGVATAQRNLMAELMAGSEYEGALTPARSKTALCSAPSQS